MLNMAREVKSTKSRGSCVLVHAHALQNLHMHTAKSYQPFELVTSSSPPVAGQQPTVALHRPVVAMGVKTTENRRAILPNDLGEGRRSEVKSSSPEISASVTPITSLSRQTSGTSLRSSKMDQGRSRSESALDQLGDEVAFDPNIALPELRNSTSSTRTIPAFDSHLSATQPNTEYIQQASQRVDNFAIIPYRYLHPISIFTRPVGEIVGSQVAYGYQGQQLVGPPFVPVDAFGHGYTAGHPIVPQYIPFSRYQSQMYSMASTGANRQDMDSNWRGDRHGHNPNSAGGLTPFSGDRTAWDVRRPSRASRALVVARPGPILTSSPIGFNGMIPSSYDNIGQRLGRVSGKKVRAEKKRGLYNLYIRLC